MKSLNVARTAPRPWLHGVAWSLLAALAACGGSDDAREQAIAQAEANGARMAPEDRNRTLGPIDDGTGAPPIAAPRRDGKAIILAAPGDGPEIIGRFTPAAPWPVVPIHAVVLPDGRVMSYGTNELGQQTGQFNYAVWDPTLGTGTESHLLLPNATGTDLFCSGQIVLPRSGEVLLTGGDLTIDGDRNYSVADVNVFDYLTNSLRRKTQSMAQPRWYPSVVTLTDGSALVLGGRDDFPWTAAISTPELYDPATGWRSLNGATSNDAYGSTANAWWYPRAWVGPDARVFVATESGRTFKVDTGGTGSIVEQPLTIPPNTFWYPSIMFAPGKILTTRLNRLAGVIDINPATPTYTPTAPVSQDRLWANATVMADGQVLLTGGSAQENEAIDVAYHAEIWNPATGTWTVGASATRMRLYHSTAILLADGRVLTAGGGAPGPVTNLNAEIYEPPYLFTADGSGTYAPRPVIRNDPLRTVWGASFTLDTATPDISKVAFVKTGSVTHSVDFDQRYMELPFTQSGNTLTVQAPASAAVATPGNYMVFVFDAAGVPSVAKIMLLTEAPADYPNSITVRARTTLAAGVGATMEVRLNGQLIGTRQLANTAYQDFAFALASVAPGGARLDVVYTNDAVIGAENRNLSVESVVINRQTLRPTDTGVVFDRGNGAAAFDNASVIPGTGDLTINGALRFAVPGAGTTLLTVRARADLALDIGPVMQVLVNGALVASTEVRSEGYTDHQLRLPVVVNPGAQLDIVYSNDGSTSGDRNLHIESIVLGNLTLRPTDPGVSIDIGSGAAAFDGETVIPGQSGIYWNAALRFAVPVDNTPRLVVRAAATLAGGVGPTMQVRRNGSVIGSMEVQAMSDTDHVFPLATAVAAGDRIDIVFDNDITIDGQDRNLFVTSITLNGTTVLPTDPGVTIDIGAGAAAFDGVNVITGQRSVYWNAALRLVAPDAAGPSVSVRAMGSLAAGVGPLMQVLVNGVSLGSVEVPPGGFTDFVFPLPAAVGSGARIDVVFDNDAGTASEDRNLFIESVLVNGTTIAPTDAGVTVDLGSGAAAFDGEIVIPGQSAIYWNAALRMLVP